VGAHLGVAACAGRWELVGTEEAEACAAGVEARVDVEDAVTLGCQCELMKREGKIDEYGDDLRFGIR
jgi:hypothetical protein